MTRTIRAAAVTAVLAAAGIATPQFATTPAVAAGLSDCVMTSDLLSPYPNVVRDALEYSLTQLRLRGVNTDRVEVWGGCLRAFVKTTDGRTVNRFFDPTTFAPVVYGNAGIGE
ncbi:MAG TPA: hypothetical protein VIL84_00995 [Devosiaceae bacterium]